MRGRRAKLSPECVARIDRWRSMGLSFSFAARMLKVNKQTAIDAGKRQRGYKDCQ